MEKQRCCCNCRHNIRSGELSDIKCNCEIDGHSIGYIQCFDGWCRHWSSDKKYWEEVDNSEK